MHSVTIDFTDLDVKTSAEEICQKEEAEKESYPSYRIISIELQLVTTQCYRKVSLADVIVTISTLGVTINIYIYTYTYNFKIKVDINECYNTIIVWTIIIYKVLKYMITRSARLLFCGNRKPGSFTELIVPPNYTCDYLFAIEYNFLTIAVWKN